MQPRDSLGGQNSYRRVSGARSSRALSTIFNQLRNLDRKITDLDRQIKNSFWISPSGLSKLKKRREILDLKRKEVRNKRKGTKIEKIVDNQKSRDKVTSSQLTTI